MKSVLHLLLLCAIVLIFLWFYQKNTKPKEGFQQSERFLLKSEENSYDNFYCEIYDTLTLPENRVKYEMNLIIKTLQPEPRFARMLDVGSGTGTFLKELKKRGFQAKGIDKSAAMVKISKKKYGDKDLDIQPNDVLDPMVYDRASFTHIFCLDFTVYEIEDKTQFFSNCYFWLQNGGYLVLHLADPQQFNPIVPAAITPVLDSIEQLGPKRITRTEIDFIDFVYVSDYMTKANVVVHEESFTDKESQNIRQNERTLYMETPQKIIEIARKAGFTAKGAFLLTDGPSRDAAQQIVIFSR
jgi:SAM-dependent methyltransferase